MYIMHPVSYSKNSFLKKKKNAEGIYSNSGVVWNCPFDTLFLLPVQLLSFAQYSKSWFIKHSKNW